MSRTVIEVRPRQSPGSFGIWMSEPRLQGAENLADFQPPLEVFAILAADESSAAEEWAGLLSAFESANFQVVLKVLVAEKDLHEEISATNSKVVSIEAGYVPTTPTELTRAIADFR